METLIHADIFFFITSIFVVLLIITFGVSMYYIIPIFRDLRHLSEVARKEGDKLVGDIDELRGAVKEEGTKIKTIFDYFIGLFIKRQKINKKKKAGIKKDSNQ
ncbi:MAG: hypothetical protein NUW02_00385 [Candidatus Campbellbacteria bacterium]|nr:hypothetical protein [Candidatus Campbellbacteria bacterium]